MHIAICDDDRQIIEAVSSFINEYNHENALSEVEIQTFQSGADITSYYSGEISRSLDIIFMDIELDRDNGINVIKELKRLYQDLIIVFITSHIRYAPDTFRVGAFQLLVKPISKKEFFGDYSRAVNKYKELHREFVISWQGAKTIVEYKDIYYIEAYNRHLYIHTKAKRYECMGKISDLEEMLNLSGFVRTHQSFVINMNYIKSINATDVLLKNGSTVFMSKYKRKEVMAEFGKYIIRN